jgi:hypothetical protein
MVAIAERVAGAATVSEQCARLGELLELDGPAPEPVLLAALQDETYARNLLVCRRTPPLLDHLLRNPPGVHEHSTLELLGRASEALLRWSRTGFATVDADTYARRTAACDGCPHLLRPEVPARLVRIAGGERPRVCGLCGCPVAKKARLTSEACPGEHPDHPGLTRWSEPRSRREN